MAGAAFYNIQCFNSILMCRGPPSSDNPLSRFVPEYMRGNSLMRFKGKDGDIDLETEHPEFNAWKWVEADQVPVLIVPFKRALYVDVMKEFAGVF